MITLIDAVEIEVPLLSLFVEAIVNMIKPIWDRTAKRLTTAEIVSICIGVVIAVVARINMMAVFVTVTSPVLLYLLYAMTGVGMGRGPSFIYDLRNEDANQHEMRLKSPRSAPVFEPNPGKRTLKEKSLLS